MAALEQYNYIFFITAILAFLDAWNIGKKNLGFSLLYRIKRIYVKTTKRCTPPVLRYNVKGLLLSYALPSIITNDAHHWTPWDGSITPYQGTAGTNPLHQAQTMSPTPSPHPSPHDVSP